MCILDLSEVLMCEFHVDYINPFVPTAPFLYPLKTSEHFTFFWCFQGVEKGYIGNEWVKNKYDNNLRLLFTGTDILMYEIKTEDVYEDHGKDKEIFVLILVIIRLNQNIIMIQTN